MSRERCFDLVAFDADDTLWHDLHKYYAAEERFVQLLSRYRDADSVRETLFHIDIHNIPRYGYGAKAYTLSMIEAALAISNQRLTADEMAEVVTFGRSITDHPIELLPGVAETLAELAGRYPLMLLTKGDLFDQERKLAGSGLAHHFRHVEVVSFKDQAAYRLLLERYRVPPERFVMVGNSLRSDVLPVVALGGHAVWIPAELTWEHEAAADAPPDGYAVLSEIGRFPAWLRNLEQQMAC
jgi:putative hydrolase of the HAD superfamily